MKNKHIATAGIHTNQHLGLHLISFRFASSSYSCSFPPAEWWEIQTHTHSRTYARTHPWTLVTRLRLASPAPLRKSSCQSRRLKATDQPNHLPTEWYSGSPTSDLKERKKRHILVDTFIHSFIQTNQTRILAQRPLLCRCQLTFRPVRLKSTHTLPRFFFKQQTRPAN